MTAIKFMTVFVFVVAASASRARAADAEYDESMSRINARKEKINRQIQELGFNLTKPDPNRTESDEGKPKKRPPRIQVHADLSLLRAPRGKTLLGRTTKRMIVGGEGSRAEVEIGDDQGLFSRLTILGNAIQNSTQDRLLVTFHSVMFRSGKNMKVTAIAQDDSGADGLKAQVFSSKALMVAGAMAGSFISGYVASQQTQSSNAFGFTQTPTTGRNAILQGVAGAAADQSKKLIDDSTKEKPVLVVERGTLVSVYFDEEVRF